VYYRDHASFSSLQSKGVDVNEKINDMMDGSFEDESNGYMCNISNDANNDGILRKTSSDFMIKGTNEEGNGEEEQDEVIMKTKEGTLAFC
jgi:hypothetical protein